MYKIRAQAIFYLISSSIALLLSAASCQEENSGRTIRAELDSEFNLSFGDTADVNEKELKITFVEVIEDSRCPVDAQCLWEGRLAINLKINDQELSLSIGGQSEAIKTISTYQITLVEVTNPVPQSDVTPKPEDYMVVLLVEKI